MQSEIAKNLRATGISIVPGFISAVELADAQADFRQIWAAGLFHKAGVGREAGLNDAIRRDEIYWLDSKMDATATLLISQRRLLTMIESLRLELNAPPNYLGLHDFEGHYANYQPGGFYRRHLDNFQKSNTRIVSVILYLNQNWAPTDGGRLRLFSPNSLLGPSIEVDPIGGTLVCFMSSEVEHEVLENFAQRSSFTGWFRATCPSIS